jgi:hypothetical protein
MVAVVTSARQHRRRASKRTAARYGVPKRRRFRHSLGIPSLIRKSKDRTIGAMADLQKLLFETQAKVSDPEILAAARLNARVKLFAGCELSDDVVVRINEAVADEADRLVADGVLRERPDWLAVIVRRRLYVAFGSSAVQQLSRELKRMGAV